MTKIVCPMCKRVGSTSKSIVAGSKVKCPACGASFRFEEPDRPEFELMPDPGVKPKAMATSLPIATAPIVPAVWEAAERPSVAAPPLFSPPFQQVIHVAAPERQRSNPIGIASLVLGILGALIAWIPFLGLLAIPAGLLGALLGLIGLVYGLVTSRGKVATAGVGMVLSLGSILLAVVMTGGAAKGINDAVKEARLRENQSARPVVASSPPKIAAETKPPDASGGVSGGAEPHAISPAQSSEAWVSGEEAARLGNVQMRILSMSLDQVNLKNKFRLGDPEVATDKSKEKLLSILLEVTNLDPNLKLDYKSVAGSRVSFGGDHAVLRDNHGNQYRRIDFGFGVDPEFRTEEESVYPHRSIRDQLVFEAPVENASHLDLEIPGKNVEQTGFFRFRISTSKFSAQR